MIQDNKAGSDTISAFTTKGQRSLIYGVSGTQKSVLLAAAFSSEPKPTLVIIDDREKLDIWKADLTNLLPNYDVYELPITDVVNFTAEAKSLETSALKMNILSRLVDGQPIIVLALVEGAVQKVMGPSSFLNSRIRIQYGQSIHRDDLVADLVKIGYERVDHVDRIGQFCIRGGIIDVYSLGRDNPIRFELFDDQIDSLREYEPSNQKSIIEIQCADILPIAELGHVDEATCLQYLSENGCVIWDEPVRIREKISQLMQENSDNKKILFGWNDLQKDAYGKTTWYLAMLLHTKSGTEVDKVISIRAKSIPPFQRQFDMVFNEIKTWRERKFIVLLYCSIQEKAQVLKLRLMQAGVPLADAENVLPGQVSVITDTTLSQGFEMPFAKLVVLTEKDIYGRQKKKARLKVPQDKKINYFRDLKVDDYVVHISHGIGKYQGVITLDVGGVHKDYFLIRYAGKDKLYVPTEQVQLLQKYIGNDDDAPKLSKLSGTDWVKAKAKAKATVTDIAKELIELYAQRRIAVGFAFEQDTTWQKEFEEAFPFVETPDQITAIREIKEDMEKPLPMDRLLCGDVGFGKTEVAMRAAFKAIMSGKQVAVLVPTTVLAQQHYHTFSARFAGFGPTVDVISRFRSGREHKATIEKVNMGQIDVLIGTHRLLQTDVQFKDLGLLIIDEEQRFGVAQKEKIKRWKADVDVLTLSATPIPRTLHMSLVGTRDMSIIETPPEDRFPIQTYVVEYYEEILRDAIRRELKRGGQVYFVYNRVQSIDKMHRMLSLMMPDARVGLAHGQMADELLERVMLDFYEGRYDVLLCTSIIENGLDVPNANTIIVYDADNFGLSQLYQMRGRVGRSRRMAFAYFTYRKDKVLTKTAEKRLQAIKEFAELGAGFKIAMRDLEIRGAGNLLGAQQHGQIVNVGFEMYCNLLEEAIAEMKEGKPIQQPIEPVLEIKADAYISGDYVSSAMHKIEVYQRIAAIRKEEHIAGLLDELIDRFGEPPQTVLNLLEVSRIKNFSRQLGIKSIIEHLGYVELIFSEQPNIDVNNILALKKRYGSVVSILPGPPEIIRMKNQKKDLSLLLWLVQIMRHLAARE